MIKINIKVGKLYRIRQGTVCWSETGKIINDQEKESGIVMVLGQLLTGQACELANSF